MIVSYVVPVYNKEEYIAESLYSILNQRKDGFEIEIIVVNDGSTDRSAEIAKTILAEKKGSVIEFTKNQGLGYALWQGFREAKGEYLCFLSPDDYLTAQRKTIKQVVVMDSDKTIDVSFFSGYLSGETYNNAKNIELPLWYNHILNWRNLCFVWTVKSNFIGSTSLMFRRSSYFKYGEWNPELRNVNDGDLMFRYLLGGAKIRMIDGCVMFYRQHGTSLSKEQDFYKKCNAVNDYYKSVVYRGKYPAWMKLALRCIPRQRY